jgi:hypothetical protein
MSRRKRKPLVQVKLRIPEDLKRQLDREAKKRDDLSLSAEIADRLRKSFEPDDSGRRAAMAVLEFLEDKGLLDINALAEQRMREAWEDSHANDDDGLPLP